MPSPQGTPFRAACIDIGSNGIRCVAAEHNGSATPHVLLQDRAPVRLGASVFQTGAIDAETMETALAALGDFQGRLARLGRLESRAVATSAVRDAKNRKVFLRRAREEAGVRIDVISGAEEARLVHVAVAQRIPLDGKPWLLVDVGGGSVEVSLATKEGISWTESRNMGAVRLLEHYRSEPDRPRRALRLIAETIETLRLPDLEHHRPAGVAATGGNIEELAGLVGTPAGGAAVDAVPIVGLAAILDEMQGMTTAERAKKWGLKPDRADVILPAGLVYAHVARLAGAKEILVPHVALKDGVLAELMQEATSPAVLPERKAVRSALALGRRYRFEESHGVHVERLALSLFDQLSDIHRLDARDRVLLAAAAVLHDIGRHIDDRKHHKHSYYLISQSEISGLSKAEVGIVAQVARYHRKAEPKLKHPAYAALAVPDRHRVDCLSALLRVADALDRQHKSKVHAVRCVPSEGRVRLELAVEGDIDLEEWAVERKGGLFERLFGHKVELAANHKLPSGRTPLG